MTMNAPPIRETPRIEALRVRNYRVLRDVRLKNLTPLTVLIGPNGSGKSTLFDVFAFLAESFSHDLPDAWSRRGGMREIRSRGQDGPIEIELAYREGLKTPRITYHLEIDEDCGSPVVTREWLSWRRKPRGRGFRFLDYKHGAGEVIGGDAPDEHAERREEPLASPDLLAVNTLGRFHDHPRIVALRNFITGWYLWYLAVPHLRTVTEPRVDQRLSTTGDNLAGVLRHLQQHEPARLDDAFRLLAKQIPQLESVTSDTLPDGNLLLHLKDQRFEEPVLARYVSDGTLKLLAYLIVLRDPDPPPLIGFEEPENFVNPQQLRRLAEQCMGTAARAQLLVSTHAPLFLDALQPEHVHVLSRGSDGFTSANSATDFWGVNEYLHAGGLLGDAWQQNLFEQLGIPAGAC